MSPSSSSRKPAPAKGLVVLVHGYGSSPETWRELKALLEHDPRIAARYDIDCFGYTTRHAQLSPLKEIPSLRSVGRSLGTHLDQKLADDRYESVTLIGHSMGGLAILTCLIDFLDQDRGADLAKICQVMLIASPQMGSTTLSGLRSIARRLISNPQERMLRAFSEDLSDLRSQVEKRIVLAASREKNAWPVPIRGYCGSEDAIVPRESARGSIPPECFRTLEGDHFTVHRPASASSLNYQELANALLHPAGHVNFWEVERFEVDLQVKPIDGGEAIAARHGDVERQVLTDNVAHIRRLVRFGRGNLCQKLFALNYGTRHEGFVRPVLSHVNETSPYNRRIYTDYGVQVFYEFTPKPGETFTMEAEIYKGFDEGRRDAHFHLRPARYGTIRFRLDLSAYLDKNWTIASEPKLYLHRKDIDDCAHLGNTRVADNIRPPTAVRAEGVWEWELGNHPDRIGEGVVDLVWDVAQPKAMPAGRSVPL